MDVLSKNKITLKVDSSQKRKRKSTKDDDVTDDLDDLFDAYTGQHLKNKRKKVSRDEDDDDVIDSKSTISSSGYQPGGKGIHRPLTTSGNAEEKPRKAPLAAGAEFRAKACYLFNLFFFFKHTRYCKRRF